MAIKPPDQGFIFWPVGTGDSTTIRVADTIYVQLDLRHMAKAEGDDDPAWPVIDELIDILPTLDRTPYLSVFALTHPDLDHCQGFEELKARVIISSECHLVELPQDGFVEPFADAVGPGRFDFGLGVADVVDGQEQLVIVLIGAPALRRSGQTHRCAGDSDWSIERYMQRYVVVNCREKTQASYRYIIEAHILPELRELLISDVDQARVAALALPAVRPHNGVVTLTG